MTLVHGGPGAAGAAHRPTAPTVLAYVLHARTVPSLAREAFAAAAGDALGDAGAAAPEAFLFRTCQRVEVYLATRADGHLPALPPLPDGAVRLADVDAVRHLIEVACGMDSAVFGEDQVLHQLRVALEERRAAGPLHPVLDRMFQSALRGGRRAHTWYDGSPRSLADVALDRIESAAGPLGGLTILVGGVGRMGRLAALAAHRRGARVVVTNRTAGRAAALAAEIDGIAVPFDADRAIPPVDGVVLAISGTWPIGPLVAAALVAGRTPVVDLSSPPCMPEALQDALGDRFTNVDNLVAGPEYAPHDRLRRRIEGLVSETGRDFCQWLRSRDSVPLVQAVAASAERVRRDEMTWLLRRLPELPEEHEAAITQVVEQMSHRLVAALLHAPLDALHADPAGELERAARDLFGV